MAGPYEDGIPESDEGTIASGDSDTTLTTVLDLSNREALFLPQKLIVDYDDAATTATTIEIHSAAPGDAASDLDADTRRKTVHLAAGERVEHSLGPMRPVDRSVVVDPDGNQDAAIDVYIAGELMETIA